MHVVTLSESVPRKIVNKSIASYSTRNAESIGGAGTVSGCHEHT